MGGVGGGQTGRVEDEWEGGERQGFNWRRAGIVLLVLAVAGVWWVQRDRGLTVERDGETVGGPSELPEIVVTSPLQAGDRYYCPSSHPVRAYDDGTYYPAHYPSGRGVIARPDECYVDDERALAAGYELADPPPGATIAGGVYVITATAPGRAGCSQLAFEAGVAVPCPTSLPAPANGPTCTESRCQFEGGVVIEQRLFSAPPEYCVGCDTHVMVTAVRGTEPRSLITCPAPPAEGEDPGSVTAVPKDMRLPRPGEPPPVTECAEGPPWIPGIGGIPHEGHTMMRWRDDDFTYAVSVEGHGQPQSELLQAIFGGIEVCRPPGRSPAASRCQAPGPP